MRQIKFKGKRIDGVYVFGDFFDTRHSEFCNYMPTIIENGGANPSDFHLVDPDTVSQFTGLLDIDRTELYEYDIITTEISLMIVVWVQITASFGAMPIKHYKELTDKKNIPTNNIYCFDNDIVNFGIHGNVFDNPELLNEKQ